MSEQLSSQLPINTQQNADEKALHDEPDDNFKSYVLYIKCGEKNSENALTLLKKSPRLAMTLVQDVSLLPRPLPNWLFSVPTLVDRHESIMKRGSEALKQLGDWAALAPLATKQNSVRGYKSNVNAYATPFDD
jgi:hypothetical protein